MNSANTSNNRKILCVDDELDILTLYQDIFSRADETRGEQTRAALQQRWRQRTSDTTPPADCPLDRETYEITLARCGEEAIEIVKRTASQGQSFAAGFFDMRMPGGLDGYETIKAIIEIDPEIHCAVVSAYSDRGIKDLMKLFPCQDQWLFLNKPFGNEELLQVAHHLISTWRLKEKNRQFTVRLQEEVRKQTDKYKETAERLILINQFSRELGTAFDLTILLNNIIEQLRLIVGAHTGSLLLVEDDLYLQVKAAVGPGHEKIIGLRNTISENRISNHVLVHKQPLMIADFSSDPRFRNTPAQVRPDFDAVISVPLLVKEEPIGVMNFGAPKAEKKFSQEELEFVHSVAGQIAMAIDNARLYQRLSASYEQLSEAYLSTVKALTKAIDAKDHYTYGHSERVACYSLAIARELDYGEDELAELHRACILHDIGKIGISEAILNKPGRLTEEEFMIIKTHSTLGAEMILEIPFLEQTRQVILHHHERFDGRGYPNGIGGEKIPLSARIMAIADTLDAMTSDRPYRKGMAQEVALAEILRCSGFQFDPMVVMACMKAIVQTPPPK